MRVETHAGVCYSPTEAQHRVEQLARFASGLIRFRSRALREPGTDGHEDKGVFEITMLWDDAAPLEHDMATRVDNLNTLENIPLP